MDNEQIKALAEAYLSPHFLNEHEGYNVTEEEIFAAGYHAGRAAGLALAAKIALDRFPSGKGWDDGCIYAGQEIAQAIRAASEGK